VDVDPPSNKLCEESEVVILSFSVRTRAKTPSKKTTKTENYTPGMVL
jgi:hypothetical protein